MNKRSNLKNIEYWISDFFVKVWKIKGKCDWKGNVNGEVDIKAGKSKERTYGGKK